MTKHGLTPACSTPFQRDHYRSVLLCFASRALCGPWALWGPYSPPFAPFTVSSLFLALQARAAHHAHSHPSPVSSTFSPQLCMDRVLPRFQATTDDYFLCKRGLWGQIMFPVIQGDSHNNQKTPRSHFPLDHEHSEFPHVWGVALGIATGRHWVQELPSYFTNKSLQAYRHATAAGENKLSSVFRSSQL